MKLGIIGTAGRKEDGEKLNRELYIKMFDIARKTILNHNIHILVSGGSGWSDHLAVRLYLKNFCPELILHIPCNFYYWEDGGFIDTGDFDFKTNPGRTLNYYHEKFSKKIGIDSLRDIQDSIGNGAELIVTPGLFERNTKVAQDSDILLAFTFGDGPKIKDGGTADTCRKYLKMGKKDLYHFNLNELKLYHGEV